MNPAKFKTWVVEDKFFIVDINILNYDIGPLTTIYLSTLILTAIFPIPPFSIVQSCK